jgi:hypothetical protein
MHSIVDAWSTIQGPDGDTFSSTEFWRDLLA